MGDGSQLCNGKISVNPCKSVLGLQSFNSITEGVGDTSAKSSCKT